MLSHRWFWFGFGKGLQVKSGGFFVHIFVRISVLMLHL
jgi:hypothetical protein